jgi:hypothetical protein
MAHLAPHDIFHLGLITPRRSQLSMLTSMPNRILSWLPVCLGRSDVLAVEAPYLGRGWSQYCWVMAMGPSSFP